MIPLNNSVYKFLMIMNFIRKKRTPVFKILKQLKKSQYYTTDELINIQTKKLKKLIDYSYNNVPYYHELLKNNSIYPDDIKKLDDLKKIPLLTKKIIQTNLNKLISRKINYQDLHKNHTGGSTAKALIFYQCKNYLNYADAGRILAWYNFPGFDYGARTAILWGAERDIKINQSFFYKLRQYRSGTITMNSNIINDLKFQIFYNKLKKFKPFILRGYPSVLYLFAKYIDKNNLDISDMKSIITSAEVLQDYQRKKLEETFQCDILNSYGSREVSQIAMECTKHNGLHVMMENQIVEIINSNEEVTEKEVGDIIVTNLNNFGMPFIRYKIEDRARKSTMFKCECNRGLSLIDSIIGRKQDRIKISDGSFIDEPYFGMKLSIVPGIKEYQIIQNEIDKIIILIVGDKEKSINQLKKIKNQIINDIGKNFHIEIKYTDKIDRSSTGKYRMLITKFKE